MRGILLSREVGRDDGMARGMGREGCAGWLDADGDGLIGFGV